MITANVYCLLIKCQFFEVIYMYCVTYHHINLMVQERFIIPILHRKTANTGTSQFQVKVPKQLSQEVGVWAMNTIPDCIICVQHCTKCLCNVCVCVCTHVCFYVVKTFLGWESMTMQWNLLFFCNIIIKLVHNSKLSNTTPQKRLKYQYPGIVNM